MSLQTTSGQREGSAAAAARPATATPSSSYTLKVQKRRIFSRTDPTDERSNTIPPPSRPRRSSLPLPKIQLFGEDYRRYIHERMAQPGVPLSSPATLTPIPAWIKQPSQLNGKPFNSYYRVSNLSSVGLICATEDLAKHAYWYAHWQIRLRRVSGRTAALLQQYKVAAQESIHSPGNDTYLRLATLNETLHSKAFLNRDQDDRMDQLLEAVEALERMRYLANYGDYVKEECLHFRIAAKEKKAFIKGAEYFVEGTTWTAVQRRMDEEQGNLDHWFRQSKKGPMPFPKVTRAIEEACNVLGFGEEGVKHAIWLYAERNECMHSDVGEYIKHCDFKPLGQQLIKDRRHLPAVFGGREKRLMQEALDRITQRYFVDLSDFDDPKNSPLADRLLQEKLKKQFQALENKLRAQEKKDGKKGGKKGGRENTVA